MRSTITILAVIAALAGCGTSTVGTLRFRNEPTVWRVNDRADVPNKPEERKYARTLYHVDGYVVRRLTRAMELSEHTRASNVNALDEVPDSTWFINRIGVREMSLDELRRGPALDEGPGPHKPWTVKGTKVGGTAVGFLIADSRGVKYLLKFDDKAGPEAETAAHVIVQRILWACGYNVPDDRIAYFRREDLVVAPDASKKDVFGHKTPMTVADLEEGLAKVDIGADGTYRGLVSRYLPGIPIGPYAREGTRADDPNDIIPHERRRELRGQFAIFSWLNHTDLQEDNTLDVWEADPNDPDKHYVVHYLIDFGKALGVMGLLNKWNWVGHTMRVDFSATLKMFLTLGLWDRPWEVVADTGLRGVGFYGVDEYSPGKWRPNSPYWPLEDKDRFDAFWGAKILIRFTPDQLRAIVEEAQLSDPRAVDYLVDTLVARQRKTARYWFRKVAPLDAFAVTADGAGRSLCFDDLMLKYELASGAGTIYRADGFDAAGDATGWSAEARPGDAGRVCLTGVEPTGSGDGYLIVRVRLWRGYTELPATLVHLARDPDGGALRVIGLRRQ